MGQRALHQSLAGSLPDRPPRHRRPSARQPRPAATPAARGGERDGIRWSHVESTASCEQEIRRRTGAKSLGADHGGVETLVDQRLHRPARSRIGDVFVLAETTARFRPGATRCLQVPPRPGQRGDAPLLEPPRKHLSLSLREAVGCVGIGRVAGTTFGNLDPSAREERCERPRAWDVPRRTCGSQALDRTG